MFVLFSFGKIKAHVCVSDEIIIRTQELIDNFPKNNLGCPDVNMNLGIAQNFTNHFSLHQIIKINGDVSVSSNNSLTRLNERENITSNGGYMDVNNTSLVNQGSLKNLTVFDGITKKERPYKIWVTPMDNTPILYGYLHEVMDRSIIIKKPGFTETSSLMNFHNIQTIKYRKEGSIGRGFLFGTLTGFVVGALGTSPKDHNSLFLSYNANQGRIINGVLFALPGAVIGGVLGSLRIKIPINGNYKTFEEQRESLLKLKMPY